MNVSIQRILELKFLPIVDIGSVRNLDALIETMLEYDVNILQMNVKNLQQSDEASVITDLHRKYPEMSIGVGFLNNAHFVEEVVQYGAKFVVSSILAKEILSVVRPDIAVILSGFTPTEIHEAHHLGLDMVQIFPAAQLHTQSITSILEYLPDANFILTGGLSVSNALNFLRYGARAVGVKGSIFPKEYLMKEDYREIGKSIKNFRDRVQLIERII